MKALVVSGLLLALLVYAAALGMYAERAHHTLEHGPEAKEQLDRALRQYYDQNR